MVSGSRSTPVRKSSTVSVGVVEVQSLEFGRLILAEKVSEGEPVRESLRARAVGEVRRSGGE